jgi:hypothetical protein
MGTVKNRVGFERERELLDFARSYLSETFPNPERTGCPPDDALRALASRPTQSDYSISDHLTCCSPCFNAYMTHLARARVEVVQSRVIRRTTWIRRSLISAGIAVMLMVASYGLFTRRHRDVTAVPRPPAPSGGPETPAQVPTAVYVSVLVDLSNASPQRGLYQGEGSPLPQVILSSSLVDLSLRLPLGSEERRYSILLTTKRNIVWSGSAKAHLENGRMLLHMHADFSRVPAGRYDLVTVSKGFRVTARVLMKSTSSGRIQ